MTQPLDLAKAESITIPIADWRDEVIAEENLVERKEDMIAMIAAGATSGKIAKRALVSRELGVAPANIMRNNKLLLYTAAQAEVAALARSVRRPVTVRSGAVYDAPRFVGATTKETHDGNGNGTHHFEAVAPDAETEEPERVRVYLDTAREDAKAAALARSQHYLREVVPGYIEPRLLTIYDAGGAAAVREEVKRLKAAIDEIAHRFLSPSAPADAKALATV